MFLVPRGGSQQAKQIGSASLDRRFFDQLYVELIHEHRWWCELARGLGAGEGSLHLVGLSLLVLHQLLVSVFRTFSIWRWVKAQP